MEKIKTDGKIIYKCGKQHEEKKPEQKKKADYRIAKNKKEAEFPAETTEEVDNG